MHLRRQAAAARGKAAAKPARGRRPQARKLRIAKDALYREHIMEVAEQVFAAKGYTDTRMQDIASVAGISLGTLYQSYAGKQELHRSLLIARDEQMLERVLARVQTDLQTPQSVEQVLAFLQIHLYYLLDHPDYLRMLLQEGYVWYHQSAQPTAVEQQMWNRGIGLIQQMFVWGMQQGLFSPANPEQQARMLMGLQQAQLANWVSGGMEEAQTQVVARIQADFVRLFCRPEHITRLLSADGAALNTATQQRIAELSGTT